MGLKTVVEKSWRNKMLFLGIFAVFASAFLFTNSAYAANSASISSSGKVSFGKVQPNSSGTVVKGQDSVSVSTTCSTGVNVYATGTATGDTNLTNTAANSNNVIATSSAAIGSAATLEQNTWGLTTSTADNDDSKYYGLPAYSSSSLPTAIFSGALPTSGSAYTGDISVYYGAKVNSSLTPGSYIGSVLYTAIVDTACLDYDVAFDKNSSSATGTMETQTIRSLVSTKLSPSNFKLANYSFLGWSTSPNGHTGTATNGVGVLEDVDYTDEEAVTDLTGAGETITLYAIYGKPDMQSFTRCDKMDIGETTTAIDTRDGREYKVRKLADGLCWMVQNLALGSGSAVTLTPDKSNVTANFNLQASNISNFGSTIKNTAATYYVAGGTSNVAEDTVYYNFYAASAGFSYYQDGMSFGYSNIDVCPKGWRLPTGKNGGDFMFLIEALGGSGEYNSTSTAVRSALLNTDGPAWSYTGYVQDGSLQNVNNMAQYYTSTVNNSTNSRYGYLNSSAAYWPYADVVKYRGLPVRCINKSQDYTINYDLNGGTGTISKTTEGVVAREDAVTMPTASLTKTGYTFAGYSSDQDMVTHAGYNPGTSYDVENLAYAAGTANHGTITLYAVWVPDATDGDMQNWSGCASLGVGDTVRLVDTRDSRAYAVRKLVDNKCWMIENLALGSGSAVTLTSDKSNVASEFTVNASNISATATGANAYTYYAPKGSTANFATAANAAKSVGSIPEDTTYYNFYAATAGFSYQADGKTSGTSQYSVCPRGWRLPAGGSNGDFATLDISFSGSGTNRWSPNFRNNFLNPQGPAFIYSGGVWGSLVRYLGEYGYWWSSTVATSADGYGLYLLMRGSMYPQSQGSKSGAGAVRCVAGS